MADAVDVVPNSNHTSVQNLLGWSLRGTFVARLRRGAVDGQILGTVENDSHVIYPRSLNAQGGTYVEVVSGTITEGVLYYL